MKDKCCGNCKHFKDEDLGGFGWCDKIDNEVHCTLHYDCHEDLNGWTEITSDNIDEFVFEQLGNNPEYFESYILAGDYYEDRKEIDIALNYWKAALDKEYPYQEIKIDLELKKIKKYDKGQDTAL